MEENNNFEQNDNLNTSSEPVTNDSFSQEPPASESFDISPRKNKKSILPFIAAGLAVVGVGASVAVAKTISAKSDPKKIAETNYNDFIDRETIYSQIAEEKLMETIASGEYTAEGNIKIDDNTMQSKLNGAELTFSNVVHKDENKASLDMMAKYNGVDLVRIMVNCDDKATRLHVPALFSESFYIENDNVINQLSQSPLLASYAKDILDESGDFSIKPFVLADAFKASYDLRVKIKQLKKDSLSAAGDSLIYEKGEKMLAPNEKEVRSFTVTLPADSVKTNLLGFVNGIKDSEEYKNAISAQLEFFYATKPDIVDQIGTKDEAIAELTKPLDDAAAELESAEYTDIKLTCLPVDDGIYFRLDQPISGTNVKIDGEYNRTAKALKADITLEKDGKTLVINYNDSINTVDGIINESHSFTATQDNEDFKLTSNATFDKSNGALDGSASIGSGSDTINGNLKANVEKSEEKLSLSDAVLSFSADSDKIDFSGSYTVKKRDEDVREINSASEIKLSELDSAQAMKLYTEAQNNLGSIMDVIK